MRACGMKIMWGTRALAFHSRLCDVSRAYVATWFPIFGMLFAFHNRFCEDSRAYVTAWFHVRLARHSSNSHCIRQRACCCHFSFNEVALADLKFLPLTSKILVELLLGHERNYRWCHGRAAAEEDQGELQATTVVAQALTGSVRAGAPFRTVPRTIARFDQPMP